MTDIEATARYVRALDPGWFAGAATRIDLHAAKDASQLFRGVAKAAADVSIHAGTPGRIIEVRDGFVLPGKPSIWTADGRRVPQSCVRRGPNLSQYVWAGEETLTIPADHDTIDDPLVYLSYLPKPWGHFLTESTSRLWAISAHPELARHRMFFAHTDLSNASYSTFFRHFGVEPSRLWHVRRPTRIRTCYIPVASFSIRAEAFEVHTDSARRVAMSVLSDRPESPTGQPVYLSRTRLDGRRIIRSELTLERHLEAAGFRIVHPQLLSLEEQVGVFRRHKVFVGCWGSAFHNILFSEPAETTTHIMCEGVPNMNYLMIDAITGNRANYVEALAAAPGKKQVYPNLDSTIDVEGMLDYLRSAGLVGRAVLQRAAIGALGDGGDIEMNRAQSDLPPSVANYSVRRINRLAELLDGRSYLEIGVRDGNTFSEVRLPHKVGVDKKFALDLTSHQQGAVEFHEVSSDVYFTKVARRERFDVIFLDGLHTFEQTSRDFFNSLVFSSPCAVWLIDDTEPSDPYSALPSIARAIAFRERETGSRNRSWHGDVYKLVFLIHDFLPCFNYRTIIGSGNPQTLLWRSPQADRAEAPRFGSMETISRLDYFAFRDNIDLLRQCDEATAIEICVREVEAST